MPKIVLEIANIEENIARPAVMGVLRELNTKIGLLPGVKIRFVGSGNALALSGSTMDDRGASSRLPGDAYISVSADEEYDENYAMSVAIFQAENASIFTDKALDIRLTPVYQRITTNIDVKMVMSDKSAADNLISTIKRRFSQRVVENLHTIEYAYPLPIEYVAILLELHRLREANKGYGEDIGTWLSNNFTSLNTTITDQAGAHPIIVMKEKQINLLGWFDFTDQPPKVERATESGNWSVSFNYTFSYDRVESIVMQYPLMVHNQLLDNRYYNDIAVDDLNQYMQQRSYSMAAIHEETYQQKGLHLLEVNPGISIPPFDDWLPNIVPLHHHVLLRVMLQVDVTNPHAILSIPVLGDWRLYPEAIEYLKANPIAILTPNACIFNIQLYRGKSLLNPNEIIVSPDLDLHLVYPMDERAAYHLSMTMLTNILRLTPAALLTLAEHGYFAIRYLVTIIPELGKLLRYQVLGSDNQYTTVTLEYLLSKEANYARDIIIAALQQGSTTAGLLPKLTANGTLRLSELKKFLSAVSAYPSSNAADYSWRLVNQTFILAHEK